MPTEQQSKKLDGLIASLAAAQEAHKEAPAAPASDNEYSAPSGPDGATVVKQDNIASMPRQIKPPVMNTTPVPPQNLFDGQRRLPAPTSLAESLNNPVAPPVPALASPFAQAITQHEPVEIPSRLFFTGQSKAGLSHVVRTIGAIEISALESADLLAANLFGTRISAQPGGPETLQRIIAYGDGVYSEKYPASLERALVLRAVATLEGWNGFGQPGFWVGVLIEAALKVESENNKRVVVTGVNDARIYKSLVEAGFEPWHVMASPTRRAARGAPKFANQFQTALDNNVIKQLSAEKRGKRLHVIWSDEGVTTNSPRIWPLDTFAASAASTPETITDLPSIV